MSHNDRVFDGDTQRLREPERVNRMEVDKVVGLCLKGIQAKSMLDVGTGSGVFAEAFTKQGLSAAGVDLNQRFLDEAQKFVPDGVFKRGKAEELPFETDSVDLVFMGVVLHETDDGVAALREARRVSRMRTCILEWPHRTLQIGPPMDHRLSQKDIEEWARMAGYSHPRHILLTHLDLYLLDN